MTLALYADHHVNLAIVEGLRRRGIDVVTAFEDGFDRCSDADILSRAGDLGRVIFTQDVDFITLTDEWIVSGKQFSGVVFAHQLKITIGQSIRDLELVCRALAPADVANRLIRLPL